MESPEQLRCAAFAALGPTTLYQLLRLRVDAFVVEQQCPYPELDGRDTEPHTWHVWTEHAGTPVGYLRVLREPDGDRRIGRVVVAPSARRAGVASRLLTGTLARLAGHPCVLDAQSHLVDFYRRFGFECRGAEFVEDGIPHRPMRRPVAVTGASPPPRRPGAEGR